MPELPDVERFRRVLESHAVGRPVAEVRIRDEAVVRAPSSRQFAKGLTGRAFDHPLRQGKWLIAPTDGPTLLAHFGMTGSLIWNDPPGDLQRFDRVVIVFDDGELIFRDQRKFGGLWLARNDKSICKVIGDLGPDALGLKGRSLRTRLESKRGALKSTLMDQSVLAGLGNMLSDEVLWLAEIHPGQRYDDLDNKQRHQLDLALQRVLRASVKTGAIPRKASWLSSQRSRPEPRCPRCHGPLRTSQIGGRTSYWCPRCQPPTGHS